MIEDSVAFLKAGGAQVFFDAEHYFDGYRADREFALETLRAAQRGGAECLILCDTNGGSMPLLVRDVVAEAVELMDAPIGRAPSTATGSAPGTPTCARSSPTSRSRPGCACCPRSGSMS